MDNFFSYLIESKEFYIGYGGYLIFCFLLAVITKAQDSYSFKDNIMGVLGLVGIGGFIWIWRSTNWTLGLPALITFCIGGFVFEFIANKKDYVKTEEQKAKDRENAAHKYTTKEIVGMIMCSAAFIAFATLSIMIGFIVAIVVSFILGVIGVSLFTNNKKEVETKDPTRNNWDYWEDTDYYFPQTLEGLNSQIIEDMQKTQRIFKGDENIRRKENEDRLKTIMDMYDVAVNLMINHAYEDSTFGEFLQNNNDDESFETNSWYMRFLKKTDAGDMMITEYRPKKGDCGVVHRRCAFQFGSYKLLYHIAEGGDDDMCWWFVDIKNEQGNSLRYEIKPCEGKK